MKSWLSFLLCGSLLATIQPAAGEGLADDEKDVMTTLEVMAKAYIQKDLVTLGKIYHDDMSYGHSTGDVQTKAQVLEAVRTRTTEYFTFSDANIRIIGSVALFRGVERLQVVGDRPSTRGVLWVLAKGKGPYGWQIIARQNWPVRS